MLEDNNKENIPPSWVDLPKADSLQHAEGIDNAAELREKLTKYHAIPKDKTINLPERCKSLSSLANYFKQKASAKSKYKPFYKGLAHRARSKERYLSQIYKLHQNGTLTVDEKIYDSRKIKDYFNNLSAKNKIYKPLILNNTTHYDSHNGHFWGEFWLEAIDPCHRPLEEYKEKWLQKRKNGEKAPFFLWLENNTISSHHKRIDYLHGEDLNKTQLLVQDGKLMQKDKSGSLALFDTPSGKSTLFVINKNEKLHIVYDEKNYRHVSLSHGKAVIAAGEIKVKNGRVTELFTNSGHYLPNHEFVKQMIDSFNAMGVKLDSKTKLRYFSNNTVVTTNVENFSISKQKRLNKKPKTNFKP